jgi:hypothetical protein
VELPGFFPALMSARLSHDARMKAAWAPVLLLVIPAKAGGALQQPKAGHPWTLLFKKLEVHGPPAFAGMTVRENLPRPASDA